MSVTLVRLYIIYIYYIIILYIMILYTFDITTNYYYIIYLIIIIYTQIINILINFCFKFFIMVCLAKAQHNLLIIN